MNSALQKELINLKGLPLIAGISWIVIILLTLVAISIVLIRKPKVVRAKSSKKSNSVNSTKKGF